MLLRHRELRALSLRTFRSRGDPCGIPARADRCRPRSLVRKRTAMMGTCPLMLMRPSACVPAPDQSIARCGRRSRSTAGATSSSRTSPCSSVAATRPRRRTSSFPPRSHRASRPRSRCTPTPVAGRSATSESTSTTTTDRRRAASQSSCTSIPRFQKTAWRASTKVAASCPVRRAIESGIVFDERVVLDQPPLGAGLSPVS